MKFLNKILIVATILGFSSYVTAASTQRVTEVKTARVEVWKTIIYPGKQAELKMHRHDKDRVLVALTDGVLKVTNDKGQTHLIKLKREHAYYLTADAQGEVHTDENMSGNVIRVIVINLN